MIDAVKRIKGRIREKLVTSLAGLRIGATTDKSQLFDRYPVVWLRTPKCASSSVHFALKSADRLIDFIGNRETIVAEDLTDATLRSKILCIGAARKDWFIETYPEIWKDAFKWALVRDPYKRVISAWKYLDDTRDRNLEDVLADPPGPDNWPAYQHLVMPLSEMISVNGVMCVDQILKVETLAEDWAKLAEHLGCELPSLPVLNKGVHAPAKLESVMSDRARALIQERYMGDFDVLEYKR